MIDKPPLGLKPKYIHDAERAQEIKCAIARYMEHKKRVPPEWVDEFNELTNPDHKADEIKLIGIENLTEQGISGDWVTRKNTDYYVIDIKIGDGVLKFDAVRRG